MTELLVLRMILVLCIAPKWREMTIWGSYVTHTFHLNSVWIESNIHLLCCLLRALRFKGVGSSLDSAPGRGFERSQSMDTL